MNKYRWKVDPNSYWMDNKSYILDVWIKDRYYDLATVFPSMNVHGKWFWVVGQKFGLKGYSSAKSLSISMEVAKIECQNYLSNWFKELK